MKKKRRSQTELSAPPPAAANDQDGAILTVSEVAARWRVSRHTVVAAIRAGRLQAFRVGNRHNRIREAEVLRFEREQQLAAVAS